jgi:pectinesterase inhibitor-like protein
MKTLGADPASADVDALGLAVVAVNIARSVVMATEGRIQMVPARWDCLRKCVSEYYITLGRLAMASRYLRGGGDMRKAARTKLAEVLGTTQRCDTAFAEAGQRSPLTTWDRQLDQVVELAIRITPSS